MTAKEHIIEDVNRALVKTVLSSHPERITADTLRCQFYNERKEEIYFTSMQRSFMKMLMESEDKRCRLMTSAATCGREKKMQKSLCTLWFAD